MAAQFDAILNFQVAGNPERKLQDVGRHAKAAGESAEKHAAGMGGAWAQSTAALGRLSPALASTGMAAGETAGALGALASMALNPITLGALGAAAAVGGVGLVLGELAKTAMEVNAEVARAGRSIGAALNATYQFGKEGKDHAVNYATAMEYAGGVVDQLQERQIELGESMPVLAEGYLKMVPAVERAGMGTEAVMDLMEKSTFAAKALGVGAQEAYFAVQGFMETGMARGEFLKQLGLAGEKFGQMSAKGRYQAIIERMGEMEKAGREAAHAVGNTWHMTWDDIRDAVGVNSKAMSEEIGSFVRDFSAFWETNKDTFITAIKAMADAGAWAFREIRENAMFAMEKIADVVDIMNKMSGAGRGPAQTGGYQAEGAIGMVLPAYGFEEAKRAQESWWDKLIGDVRAGKKKPGEARAIAEDFMRAIQPEDQWAMNIAISRSQQLGQTKPMPAATLQVTQNFGDVHIHQKFDDQDPDRVAVALQRDLTRLAQQRRQSAFTPAFGF